MTNNFNVEKPALFRVSISDDCTDLYSTLNCLQWPGLYMSCEATYALKCSLFKKIVKNQFSPRRVHKKQFFANISKTKRFNVYAYMLLHSTYINVIIAHILVYSKSLYDLQGPS